MVVRKETDGGIERRNSEQVPTGKQTMQRDKNEDPVQIDFVNLDHQTLGSLMPGHSLSIALSKYSTNLGKVSRQPPVQTVQFQVHSKA